MNKWLTIIKQPTLKAQSYNRLKSTIKNQIENTSIGHTRYNMVTTEEIQSLINKLNNDNYSHSVIKKTFDALNDFYRYISAKDKIDNPMLLVNMPTTDNIKAETKTVEFFEQDDIDKFITECSARYNTGTLKYRSGYAIASNIYMGMRIGELLALQWKDIDFESNTAYVCKTLIEIDNPEYDPNNKELMKEKGIKKVKFIVQNSTKKSKNRYVPINSKAKELLLLHKQNSQYTEPTDYIINTRNRKTNTIKNISDTIKSIEKAAETKVQASGTHVLRHTCASLYFRKGVGIETICQILGNTREVCEKTYVHFIEEQLKDAASKIDVIEI
jgi:integrase